MNKALMIFCDEPNPRHPRKRPTPTITSFHKTATGWTEINRSPHRLRVLSERARGGLPDSGTTLVGDEIPSKGAALDPGAVSQMRSVYDLRCRHCEEFGLRMPYQYKQETLFQALDTLAHAGKSAASLAELGAIVQHMAQHRA